MAVLKGTARTPAAGVPEHRLAVGAFHVLGEGQRALKRQLREEVALYGHRQRSPARGDSLIVVLGDLFDN